MRKKVSGPVFSDEQDLKFVKRTEKAWKEYNQGKFKRMSTQDFLKEIRSLK
ncbi:hypothetical protein J4422_02180 [Candidatus Pacearchaeota archaeon]|nr:hypothetical protein [Candidatus Pacearchaeota archaeon]